MENFQKIRLLSRLLRAACYIGMAGLVVLLMMDWVYGGIWIQEFKETRWYIDFSDVPTDHIEYIPMLIKIAGFITDLIHNAFLFAMLFCFSKLFTLYEQPHFFTKHHVHYLRLGGSFLFVSQIFHPFYFLLRKYLWALPDQRIIIAFSSLIEFKALIFSGIVFLFAYIIEGVIRIEEDYKLTV